MFSRLRESKMTEKMIMFDQEWKEPPQDDVMVHLHHPCREIDIWVLDDVNEEVKIARGQGYISLTNLRKMERACRRLVNTIDAAARTVTTCPLCEGPLLMDDIFEHGDECPFVLAQDVLIG